MSSIKFFGKDPLLFTMPVSLLLHTGLYAMGFKPPQFPESPPSPTFDVTMIMPQDLEEPDIKKRLGLKNPSPLFPFPIPPPRPSGSPFQKEEEIVMTFLILVTLI